MEYKNQTENRAIQEMLQAVIIPDLRPTQAAV